MIRAAGVRIMAIDIDVLIKDRTALEALLADYERLKNVSPAYNTVDKYELLDQVMDHAIDELAVFDRELRLVYMNKSFADRLQALGVRIDWGISNTELLSRIAAHLPYLESDEKRNQFVTEQTAIFMRTMETGKPEDFARADGSHCRITVREIDKGFHVYQQTDVTTEVHRQIELQTILESANQGIVFFNSDRTIQYMNPAYIKIMELEEFIITSESTMASVFDFIRREGFLAGKYEDDAQWAEFMEGMMAYTAEALKTPSLCKMSDDKYFELLVKKFDDGRMISCVSDVSDLQLKQIALEAETEKAQAAERAKSEFLANMSHEIRTPMNGVMGMAELLMGTELDSRQRTFADTIVKSGEALLTIINDILDFSKIDAGQIELHPAPFDLREAIEDVVTLIAPRVASKDLELAVRVDPALPDTFIGDVGRIRQVITNLVGNAVKFTDEGHVVVEVTGERLGEESGAEMAGLVIRVEDTGVGIPKEKCATVFDKFSQVDTSAARRHEGTGLGLSITSSLIELMGGEISVESDLGKGSVFAVTMSLPVHGESCRKRFAPIDLNGARILIVDDNEVNRTILLEQTAAWGFTSKAASSGQAALSMLEAAGVLDDQFDLVIMDYHMPEMTGADTVVAMREQEAFADIPVVMLASVDQLEDGKSALSLGVQAHLTKPARSSLLLETLISALQDAKGEEIEESDTSELQSVIDKNIAALRTSAAQAAQSKDKALRPHTAPVEAEAPVEILVAEDNHVNQLVFTQTLEDQGRSFRIANNGAEAIALYKQIGPRLILMDISMPEMNGLEATAAIRDLESETGGHTPIIAVTAHAMSGDKEKYLDAGMDDYLSKPISPAKLQDMVQKWLAKDALGNRSERQARAK